MTTTITDQLEAIRRRRYGPLPEPNEFVEQASADINFLLGWVDRAMTLFEQAFDSDGHGGRHYLHMPREWYERVRILLDEEK